MRRCRRLGRVPLVVGDPLHPADDRGRRKDVAPGLGRISPERQNDVVVAGFDALEFGHQSRIGLRRVDQGLPQMIEPFLHLINELGSAEDGPPQLANLLLEALHRGFVGGGQGRQLERLDFEGQRTEESLPLSDAPLLEARRVEPR